MVIDFSEVTTDTQIAQLAKLARTIWYTYFPDIIGQEQTEYMVSLFQSESAIADQIRHDDFTYFFVNVDGYPVGYAGIRATKTELCLSKLYLSKDFRGQGIARVALSFLEKCCSEKNLPLIRLTVNRYNENAIRAYEKMGFEIVRSSLTDIGGGYFMDDYIMEKRLDS
jgi:RimJ/RimL family protein N-acetyltransferase